MTQCLHVGLGDKRSGTACTSLTFLRNNHAFGSVPNLLRANRAFESIMQQSACVTALRNFCARMQFRRKDTTAPALTRSMV